MTDSIKINTGAIEFVNIDDSRGIYITKNDVIEYIDSLQKILVLLEDQYPRFSSYNQYIDILSLIDTLKKIDNKSCTFLECVFDDRS